MKRQSLGLLIGSTVVLLNSGCSALGYDTSFFADDGKDYYEAQQVPDMQIPEGIEVKPLETLLPIPTNVSTETLTEDAEVPLPRALSMSNEVSDFSLQRSGDKRWVVTQKPPAEVWPLARQFFTDNGFELAEETPETGEFITRWQPFETLSSGMSRRLNSRVSGVDPRAETRVRVRVEPGVVRGTSEVFVSSVERPAGSRVDVPWSDQSTNSSLDAALLDELVASMAVREEQGGSVSMLATKQYDAPNRVSMTRDGSGNPELLLSTDFDRAWSSVGRALQMADMRVDDMNRSTGIYFINLAQGAKKPDDEPGLMSRIGGLFGASEAAPTPKDRYQVRLVELGGNVQVTLDQDLNTVAPAEVAEKVLESIRENLNESDTPPLAPIR